MPGLNIGEKSKSREDSLRITKRILRNLIKKNCHGFEYYNYIEFSIEFKLTYSIASVFVFARWEWTSANLPAFLLGFRTRYAHIRYFRRRSFSFLLLRFGGIFFLELFMSSLSSSLRSLLSLMFRARS